ncbi:MAG: erythromycin esterase family protein [Alphaproteobacteria bacterium]|nr:erythromycin esterase family protein [Alphaproteobacteria bacterium]MDE2013060.1 erythromycin esterase family protein [Alphaproteobacteria bacterium]MDE2074180.1 erythromycin esterase family protein [Alphaproteobacteria bacterium]MDE2353102.1 erythromycin esterase family protein [Alphaproteobacteria bacterium]
MSQTSLVRRSGAPADDEIVTSLRDAAEDLPPPEKAEEFGTFFDRYGDARVVLLGEATHGTSEFYRARAAVTRHLIRHHGFNIVAVEADWPDAARIDRYVRHRTPEPTRVEAFVRFPVWMWRNEEVLELIQWLRTENAPHADASRVEFRGLDLYSLHASIAAVLAYLDRVDPDAAARARYGCLTPWQDDPAHYGHRALMGADTCEDVVTAQLTDLLDKRLEYAMKDGDPYFDAAQNARIVRAAEEYYRIMYRGARESWNLRDRHMFDTLQALMRRRKDAKAVVWAHNSHIGNAAATSMGWEGEFNIGELCRTAYGSEAVAIGFFTDRGTVAAASDWDGAMEIKQVRPARADSCEHLFRRTGRVRTLTDWRDPRRHLLREQLSRPRLERAIGVVYRPDSELLSHYFRAVLSEQFDALVWFEESHTVTPLGPEKPKGVPETYPFGL